MAVADPAGTPSAYSRRNRDEHLVRVPNVATFRFQPSSRLVVAFGRTADRNTVLDAYLGVVLPLALHAILEQEALHASAVLVRDAGVVGFCGLSGSGKSTVAHALSKRGHILWADDILVLDSRPRGPFSACIPFVPKLREPSASFLADGASVMLAREGDRKRLRALFVLDDSGNSAETIRRLPPVEAFVQLIGHAFSFRPAPHERMSRMLVRYVDLVAAIPVFQVRRSSRGLAGLPALVAEVEGLLTP